MANRREQIRADYLADVMTALRDHVAEGEQVRIQSERTDSRLTITLELENGDAFQSRLSALMEQSSADPANPNARGEQPDFPLDPGGPTPDS